MVNGALKPMPAVSVFTDQSLRAILVAVVAYWGVLAVVLPVSNIDSNIYNLGRLAVAENAGFWQTRAWNDPRQVVFPWTFDAVHYPFLKIGWGSALPSFLSFLGLVVIVFNLVSRRWGSNVGLWSVLSLLAMPTVMVQATTTKNDLPIVFGVGCWVYSLVRFKRSQSKFFVFTAALSLAFTAGSKTYAVPICAFLTVVTVWIWRKEVRTLLVFAGFYLPCIVLFGSIETYALSWQMYHRPLGPAYFVRLQRNNDGLRGLSANFIRYYLQNVSFGIDGNANQSGLARFLENRCRKILHFFHLNNVGYAESPVFNDSNLDLTKAAGEYYSDFGLIGFAALLTSSVYIWRPTFRNPCWTVIASGFATLTLISFIVGWMPWNVRYLCLSFVLFGVATATIVFGELKQAFWFRQVFGVLIIWSAFTLPFLCIDRRPVDLGRVFYDREDVRFDQRAYVRQVYDDVIALRRKVKGKWFLIAGQDSFVLPFLALKEGPWILTSQWDQIFKFPDPGKAMPLFVLVLNRPVPASLPVEIVKQYADNTYILRMR
jgi:hypothetical protein